MLTTTLRRTLCDGCLNAIVEMRGVTQTVFRARNLLQLAQVRFFLQSSPHSGGVAARDASGSWMSAMRGEAACCRHTAKQCKGMGRVCLLKPRNGSNKEKKYAGSECFTAHEQGPRVCWFQTSPKRHKRTNFWFQFLVQHFSPPQRASLPPQGSSCQPLLAKAGKGTKLQITVLQPSFGSIAFNSHTGEVAREADDEKKHRAICGRRQAQISKRAARIIVVL